MALTETKKIDQITVTDLGVVFYREATIILRDGVEVSTTYFRSSLGPHHGLDGIPEQVANICRAAWTPEVIAAFDANEAKNNAIFQQMADAKANATPLEG